MKTLVTLFFILNFPLSHAWTWTENFSQSNQWREQEEIAFSSQEKWKTNAVIIIHGDEILFERYENGFNLKKPHRLWSVTKSFSSALWGIRLAELNKDESSKAYEFYPKLKSPIKEDIRIRDLLQMSSGIKWNEFYEGNPFQSHVVKMLYLNERRDMAEFTASQAPRDFPGKIFNYSSGETNLLMGMLKNTFSNLEEYENYPWEKLFKPLEMEGVTWEQDNSKTFIGSSYLFMPPRELAKLGRLYLKKGLWEENQILPRDFIRRSLMTSSASCQHITKGRMNKFTYGYHWWLNRKCPEKRINTHPDIPENVFMALGHHGQVLAVFPDSQLIVVRMGADKKGRFDRNRWLNSIYKKSKELSL